jgi:ribonuclease HI
LGIKNLNVFSDSELVIKQLNGLYKVKNERLKILNLEVRKVVSSFESISFKHVRRELNEEADALSKEGLSK